jgi:glycosyltransferase involved in cell wall biosynthesis
VICTKGRAEDIGDAVGSVLANDHDSFELLVIDQSADDSTQRALAEFEEDDRLRYFHIDRVGLSHAYNVGISLSRAPLIAFTDDDCIAPLDWLEAVESAFQRHPDVDMLYGQTLVPPELKSAAGVLPSVTIAREEKLGKETSFRIFGMGANFAIRRSLDARVGGFDEALGGGGPLKSSQDFDYQFRAYRAGATCLLAPTVWVHHYGIREGAAWVATEVAYGIGDGAFYLKHVRCGDLLALRLLAFRFGRLVLGHVRHLRRRPSHWAYVRSYLTGMRRSFHYSIDRKRRLYELPRS